MVASAFKILFFWAVPVIFLTTANTSAQGVDAVTGKWLTDEGKALVQVYDCKGDICGKIVWLKEPLNADGSEKLDTNNPDDAKRNRPVIGLDIVWGFKAKGNNRWADGKIYDPDNGKTYSCKMHLDGDNLRVRGYIGFSLIGRTTIWRKE